MLAMLSPVVLVMNLLLFGKSYFGSLSVFLPATVVTYVLMGLSWQMHTAVAVYLRHRFPTDEQMVKRLSIAIFTFILLTGLSTTLLFYGYDYFDFLGYDFDETMYKWALIIGVIENVFVTFLHEGVSSFEKWRQTLKETEDLKKEYLQGQLLGLKSQVNPHFLFNSLNSLSSLISEDQERAEKFLDEMSKVYRYLLRNNEDQLVELSTELQFIHSFYHLLHARYGDGIEIIVTTKPEDREKMLPPLTLQILVENALNINKVSKDSPLRLSITVDESGWLRITNNVQKKIKEFDGREDTGINNISNKFRLLCQQPIIIHENEQERVILVPLIPNPQTVAV